MNTDEARLKPERIFTTSKAGTKGFVSLLSPETMPSASPPATMSAAK